MKSVLAMAALLFGFFGIFGPSGRTYHLTPGKMVPAATGTVNVSRDKNNGNVKLDLKVKNLALPASLTPPKNDYIVWIEPKDQNNGQPMKIGALGLDSKLQGELKTETAAKNFNIIVTAEQNEAVTKPSSDVVLRGHVVG
jgi:hypothetical protein